jgi:hypothetical protein
VRHLHIVARRRGVAAGMIVHQDQCRGMQIKGPLDDFARVDRGVTESLTRIDVATPLTP